MSSHSQSAPPPEPRISLELHPEVPTTDLPEADRPSAVASGQDSATVMRRAARGAFVETFAYVLNLVIRFGSNVLLTRMLEPEVFGLLAMVQLIHFSLHMLSDVGLAQSVVADPKGDSDDFLNTVWSMQVVRGLAISAVTLLATWPAAVWFKEPRMYWIVPVATLSTFAHSFASSRIFSAHRHMRLGALLKLELVTQSVGVAINLIGAYLGYGLISLLIGQFVGAVLFAGLSHWLPGSAHRDKWHMDPKIRGDVLRFGRWIFFSSALTVVSTRGDSAMLGRVLGPATLGLYNLATNIADLPESLGFRIVNSVIYPTMSRTFQSAPETFSRVFYRIRLYFDAACHIALGGLAAMSGFLIELLYDERYHAASAMLAVFTVRASIGLMVTPWESAFFARGHTHFGFRRALLASISLLIAMPVGYALYGGIGVVWGTVFARATAFFVLWPPAYTERLIRFHRELLPVAFFGAGFVLGNVADGVLRSLMSR